MFALEINGLSKSFKGKKRQTVEALKSLSLSMKRGEVFGFLGPNGAGKSTTIKCLMGLITPTSGTASIMGKDISIAESRKMVGYLPENPAFYDYMSAEEYLKFVGQMFQITPALLLDRCEEILKKLELWDARKRLMRTYSKGMIQRVGIAQTLVHDPEIFILDEPMSGLDPVGRALVKNVITSLKKQGKSVFFSTHITDDVEKVCDRVAIIKKGQLVASDNVENIMRRGIEGYNVCLTCSNGEKEEQFVDKENFQSFIQQTITKQQHIEIIEPRRKDMEAFFLEIISQ